jgi:hypothetical protein
MTHNEDPERTAGAETPLSLVKDSKSFGVEPAEIPNLLVAIQATPAGLGRIGREHERIARAP